MAKRGRKKGSTAKKSLPANSGFWRFTLTNKEYVEQFIKRGDDRQKGEIRECLLYWKNSDEYFYKQIEGDNILKKLK